MLNSCLYPSLLRRIWRLLPLLAVGCLLAGAGVPLCAQSYSQGFDASFDWGRQLGFDTTTDHVTGEEERITSIALDDQGGIFVAGSFTRRMTIGDTVLSCYTCTETDITFLSPEYRSLLSEGYLARIDSAGRFQWGITLGGPGSIISSFSYLDDLPFAVAADPIRRRVYVAGGASPQRNDTLLQGAGYVSRIGDREIPGSGPYLACFDFDGQFL